MNHDSTSARFQRLVMQGRNVLLTGQAGTGKSTLLRNGIDADGEGVAITASTGIAALNIEGSTLHRWSGMMLGPKRGEDPREYLREMMRDKRQSVRAGFDRIRNCQLLVLDEVSMLSGITFSFFDLLCRTIRRDDAPFGGIQVIATGDFLQLPPVRTDPSEPYDWPFLTTTWVEADFETVHLTTVHSARRAVLGYRPTTVRSTDGTPTVWRALKLLKPCMWRALQALTIRCSFSATICSRRRS